MSPHELRRKLAAYFGLREALGFKMHAERTLLVDFVEYVATRADTVPVRAQWAVEWASSSASRWSGGSTARRLSIARVFLRYLRASKPTTEVPEFGLVAGHRRRSPYIFTPAQIHSLMHTALQARPRGSLRPDTLATLIGLLASTGLRVGEAIRLTMADVSLDLEPPRLQINETKFRKSRFVPLHETTVEQLGLYVEKRAALGYDGLSDRLLVSEQGQQLSYNALSRWFGRLCRKHHFWPTTNDSRRPCLHSLRHSFAIERLRQWYQEGMDVQGLLPNLAVYLGHVRPQESYWYLTATPELLVAASERFASHVNKEGTS